MMTDQGRQFWLTILTDKLSEFLLSGGRIIRGSRALYLHSDGSGAWSARIAKIRWSEYLWSVNLYDQARQVVHRATTDSVEEVVDTVMPWAKRRMQ